MQGSSPVFYNILLKNREIALKVCRELAKPIATSNRTYASIRRENLWARSQAHDDDSTLVLWIGMLTENDNEMLGSIEDKVKIKNNWCLVKKSDD